MDKPTIEELLKMSSQEREKYLRTLPESEQKKLGVKLFHAQADRHVKALVDNLNSNAKEGAE